MSEDRVALITGANKGIGLQIAKDLAGHGLTVLIGSRKYENLLRPSFGATVLTPPSRFHSGLDLHTPY